MTYQYINSTGTIVPDTSTILTDVQAEFRDVFGQDLVVTADTPQGVLITGEALARAEVVNNNAAVANQLNPNIAAGVFLDAILALTGVERTPATKTLVSGVTLTGVAGTIVPEGSQAKTAAGDLFETLSTVAIGSGGTVTVDFASVEYGPIPCPINTLTLIVTSILGWEVVNNSQAGTLGTNTQSDAQARAYRNNTLGFQGVALPTAIVSAIYETEGVHSLWFQENVAATTETINGISMVGHSMYVCVQGGSDLDVATAILENKSVGCAMVGDETINVVEPSSGQTYVVKFQRPTEVEIGVQITVVNQSSLTNPTAAVKTAILNYAAGLQDGEPGFVVGSSVSVFEIASAVNRENPGLFVTVVEIATPPGGSYSAAEIPIGVDEIATIIASDIAVTVA